MAAPVLADITHFPIRIDESDMNAAYTQSQTISLVNASISDEAVDEIVNVLRESYKASSGAAIVNDPSVDVIYEEMLTLSSSYILNTIVQSMTSSAIQSLGSSLITQHMRDETSPFQAGDVYTFPFVVKPGDFTILNDAPYNKAFGVEFFNFEVDGRPIVSKPGDTTTISQWIYTADALSGPYYEGTAEDGFVVNMAIHLISSTEPVSYDYTYNVDWVVQPLTLNSPYAQSWSSTVVDREFNTYVAFFSRSSSATNSSNLVIAKFDSSGNILWNTNENQAFQDAVNTAAYREENPNLILSDDTNQLIVAYMTTSTTAGTGGGDSKIVSIDNHTASINWVYHGPEINSAYNDGTPELALSMIDNTVVLVHSVRGNTSESGGVYQGSSVNYDDIVFAKFDLLTGAHLWTTHHSVANTTATEVHPSIATDPNGNIYIVYMSSGDVNSLGSEGSFDIFFLKADSQGTVVSIQKLVGVNTNAPDVVPTLRYSSYDDTLYMSHYRQGPFEVVISKLTLEGDVMWTKTNGVNIDTVNEYVGMDVDKTNGMCVFAYSATPVRPGNYELTIGTIDPSGTVHYLERPSALQSSGADYTPSVAITVDGNLRIAYESEGSVNGGVYQGSRDIVVASLSRTYV